MWLPKPKDSHRNSKPSLCDYKTTSNSARPLVWHMNGNGVKCWSGLRFGFIERTYCAHVSAGAMLRNTVYGCLRLLARRSAGLSLQDGVSSKHRKGECEVTIFRNLRVGKTEANQWFLYVCVSFVLCSSVLLRVDFVSPLAISHELALYVVFEAACVRVVVIFGTFRRISWTFVRVFHIVVVAFKVQLCGKTRNTSLQIRYVPQHLESVHFFRANLYQFRVVICGYWVFSAGMEPLLKYKRGRTRNTEVRAWQNIGPPVILP